MLIPEGTIIDERFCVGKQIGSGGMGAVFEGNQLQIDRPVAIKFLTDLGVSPEEAFGRFQQEAQILSQISHPKIVRVFAFGRWTQYPYMVMERVYGQSLQEVLDRDSQIKPAAIIPLAIQILEALAAAHAAGVVHRDLKPSNVLITETGEVKIIDFGLAKVLGRNTPERQQLTEAGTALGSVFYMSPEQCRTQTVDGRTDLYALGCVMHNCLAGTPPFSGENPVEIMVQHAGNEIAPRIPNIEPRLQDVIDKAMEKDRDRRYQTADEMMQDLVAVQQGRAPSAVPIKITKRRKPTTNRGPRPAIVVLLCLMLACGLLAAAVSWQQDKKTASEQPDKRSIESLKEQVEIAERILKKQPYQEQYAAASQAYAHLAAADERFKLKRGEYAKNYAIRVFKLEHNPEISTPMLVRLAPNIMLGHTDSQAENITYLKERVPDVAAADGDYALARVGYDALLRLCENEDPAKFMSVQQSLLKSLLECDKQLHDDKAYNADLKRGEKFGHANH